MVKSIIKEVRLRMNFTQTDLAKKLGVTRQALCMWEADKREIGATTLKKISKILNVPIDLLISNKTLKGELYKMKTTKKNSKVTNSTIKTTTATKISKSTKAQKTITPINDKKTTPEVAVEFKLNAPTAKNVAIAGDFNNWDNKGLKLKKDKTGSWKTKTTLKPGKFEYKFIVDNDWWLDPTNEKTVWNSCGSMNSVIEVK